MFNSLVILISLGLSIPISQSNPFWILNTVIYFAAFLIQMLLIYLSFSEPGFFLIAENEIKNYYSDSNENEIASAIEFILLAYVGLTNVLIAYTLYLGSFYLIKYFLFSEEKP